jgi:hypothetical protein
MMQHIGFIIGTCAAVLALVVLIAAILRLARNDERARARTRSDSKADSTDAAAPPPVKKVEVHTKKEHGGHGPSPMGFAFYVFIGVLGVSALLWLIHAGHLLDAQPYLPVNSRDQVAASHIPSAARTSCPGMSEGMELAMCETTEAGTGLLPVLASRNANICLSGDFGTDRLMSWYTDEQGHEHVWTGSDDDRAAAKAYWRFAATHGRANVTYTVLPPSGTCPPKGA